MQQPFIKVLSWLICFSVSLSQAYGMEEDPTVYLKRQYTLAEDIPANKLWLEAQGVPIQKKKDVTIWFKDYPPKYDYRRGEEYHDSYTNYFEASSPEESSYIRKIILAKKTHYYYSHAYYVGIECNTDDEGLTTIVKESPALYWDMYIQTYKPEDNSGSRHNVLFIADYCQKKVGRFLHAFVSLHLVPRDIVIHMLTQAKMSIEIDDFDLDAKLLLPRLTHKCEQVVQRSLEAVPPDPSVLKYMGSQKERQKYYDSIYPNILFEELEKIPNLRQRAMVVGALREQLSKNLSDEASLRLLEHINQPSLPYYKDSKILHIDIESKEIKKKQSDIYLEERKTKIRIVDNQSLSEEMTKEKEDTQAQLLTMLMKYIEVGQHKEAVEIANSYLSLSRWDNDHLDCVSVPALLSMLKKKKSENRNRQAQATARKSIAYINEGQNIQDSETRFNEELDKALDRETIIHLCEAWKTSKLYKSWEPFSQKVELTRIRAQREVDLMKDLKQDYVHYRPELNPYLNAMKGFMSIEDFEKAKGFAQQFLLLHCDITDLELDLSDSILPVIDLLKLIREELRKRI